MITLRPSRKRSDSLTTVMLTSILFAAGVLASSVTAQDTYPTTPTLSPEGERWRLGYLEGGQYVDYETITTATIRGLMDLGWIEPTDLPTEQGAEAGDFWRWFAENLESDYIEIVPDAYYTAGDFDSDQRPDTREAILDRLTESGDIDLVIAMGTWAGQDLRVDGLDVPVVVGSTSDPVGAGIVDSHSDSGMDHLHARVETDRYQIQLRLFHDIIDFERLGIVYSDTREGRTFGGVDAVEEIAAERGFEVVSCDAPYTGLPLSDVEAAVISCYDEVAAQVDAIYVTVHRGVNRDSLPRIMQGINRNLVPTFSMLGSSEVQRGVLMSIAQADFSHVGMFHAQTIARIFNGASPRALPQEWSAPPKIALNLAAAERIGYDPPVDLLLASDEIYETIDTPD
ncbi:MAG: putative ABC transport system substrate-binding protein [Rhodobacteraceae bacterium HLUCCA12]|nr:MAG: putative ABC transport system substrate-binding protein [Rhodobacteraceae bacterium HLUCCA12]